MRYRLFGNTGLRVSELFLGAMTFGEKGRAGASPSECRAILDAYADAGGNVVDTAIFYREGDSESILGELLQGRRDRFVVGTKYTPARDTTDPNGGGNHRKNLIASLETSLRRLRTDHIDVYWLALWDRHTPIEETMRALDDAVRAGKILYLGVSNTPAWVVAHANMLADWRGWTAFAGLQVPYSVLNRDVERELLPMAETLGLTVAASVVQDVAAELGATPAQVAIAWTMARSRAVHPILGARTVKQLQENLGALDVTLPDEAVRRLDEATEFGLGYPGDFIARVGPVALGPAANRLDGR